MFRGSNYYSSDNLGKTIVSVIKDLWRNESDGPYQTTWPFTEWMLCLKLTAQHMDAERLC